MGALSVETVENIGVEDLNNIAENIEQKLKLLGIKLPELAKISEVDYFTLRKIINRDKNYMPNLRALIKLSDYFNISTGDLLKFNSLPQYIPVIKERDINNFFDNEIPEFDLQETVFSESYIHEYAFSIQKPIYNFNIKSLVNHICHPTQKFYKNGIFIVEILDKLDFIQIHTIKNDIVHYTKNQLKEIQFENIKNIKVIAVVVKFILNQNLI